MPLVLYRWHLDASGADPPAACGRLVNDVVIPVFRDAAVSSSAECLYAGKYWPPGEVQLTLVTEQHLGTRAAGAVAVHLAGARITQRIGPDPGDVLCRARAAWYRRRLTEVTRVALDLHGHPAHRAALLAIWSTAHNAALDAYLQAHSATYRELCERDEARAAFWADFWRRGPDGLNYPGHWIEDLVLAG